MSLRDELIRKGIIKPAGHGQKVLPMEGAPMQWASGRSVLSTLTTLRVVDEDSLAWSSEANDDPERDRQEIRRRKAS